MAFNNIFHIFSDLIDFRGYRAKRLVKQYQRHYFEGTGVVGQVVEIQINGVRASFHDEDFWLFINGTLWEPKTADSQAFTTTNYPQGVFDYECTQTSGQNTHIQPAGRRTRFPPGSVCVLYFVPID